MKFSSHQINDWLAARPWRIFWRCIPALLAGLLCLALLAVVLEDRSEATGLCQHYRRFAIATLGARQFEPARVACLRGLSFAMDERSRLEWLFYLSAALNGLGHQSEAVTLLATTAPLDRPGCVQAHVAVAQALLNATNVTDEMITQAGIHLQHALELDPQSVEINEMLGRFYINTGDFAKARQRLLEIYPLKKDVALLLAYLESASRNEAEARSWADAAIETFQKNLQDFSPQDDPAARLGLAQAFLLEQNFAAAAKNFEEGLALTNAAAYRSGLGDVCIAWAIKLNSSNAVDRASQLSVVQKGVAVSPENMKLWQLLIQLSHSPDETGLAAQKAVQQQLAQSSGTTLAWWHFWLATDARLHHQPEDLRAHLQKAYQIAPEIPQIANDLAMDLAFGQPVDLARALAVVQPVVEKFPDNPGFRDTRGRILLKLGRYAEAASDLEFASLKLSHASETEAALEEARRALGRNPTR